MDLLTFIGWTLLVFLAYKLGVHVERKLQAKRSTPQAQQETEPDPEQKR